MALLAVLIYLTTILLRASASCDAPSPAFLLPQFNVDDPGFKATSKQLIDFVKERIVADPRYDTTSFSIEVTSQQDTLFGFHHTAKVRSDSFDGGANPINDATRYRIASMTKPFVVLAILQLQKAGQLNLDDPVLKYLPELEDGQKGTLPWHDITLRALMSQQSGIPRDFAQDDFINDPETRALFGLPELDRKKLDLPTCDEMVNYTRTCNVTDFTRYIRTLLPLFAPNQHPSYSNINFNLLGLVISTVSNTTFEDYVTTNILKPLKMSQTTFTQPRNKHAAMSRTGGAEIYWPFDMGIQNAAGGLYSSTRDLSIWLRYILSTYNGQTPALNWFNPTSFSGSSQTFYGVPWEIYSVRVRDAVRDGKGSTRPMSLVTKSGGLPGYSSLVIMIPDYAVGISILIVGDGSALSIIRDAVVRAMVTYAEGLALENLKTKYVGEYTDKHTHSRLVLASSSDKGLYVHEWTSNGTDTFKGLEQKFAGSRGRLTLHVTPTLLYINETAQRGERWYALPGIEKYHDENDLFGNFCHSDWEFGKYAGKPVNELVFWTDKGDKKVVRVGMPGFRRTLTRVDDDEEGKGEGLLKVQG